MEAGTAHPPTPVRWGAYGGAVVLGLALVVAATVGLVLFGAGGGCRSGGSVSGFSDAGRADIPQQYQTIYSAAGRQFGIPPAFLAAIGLRESNHGRNPAAREVNAAGCVGPMQLGVGGACGDYFDEYKVDGNRDGRLDPLDPWDAVFTAANGLRKGGLPSVGRATAEDYFQAACRYYGACADYAPAIIATAARYGGSEWWRPSALASSVSSACAAPVGGAGGVRVAPGANRPGVPLQPVLLAYLSRMALATGRRIVVTTGTNHSQFTVDGNVSDHWDGHAADLGNEANGGVPGNDRNFFACLVLGGVPGERALRLVRTGGLITLYHAGLRIQCIWKTFEGGDHYTHVHVGVRSL